MKKIILFIIVLIIFNIKIVNAVTLKPTGDIECIRDKEITIYLTLEKDKLDKNISAVDGKIVYDENVLEIVDYTNLMDDWTMFSKIKNNSLFAYANLKYNNLVNTSYKNLIKIKFKVKSETKLDTTTISVLNPTATDEMGNADNIYGGTHEVKILSDDNYLSEINIEGTNINFDKKIYEYNLTVNEESTNIDCVLSDSNAIISGDIGLKKLDYGINKFKIIVTSQSGKDRVYKINIQRPDNRSKENRVSNLELDNIKINFDKDKLNYDIYVDNDITDININANLLDKKSSFVLGYEPRNIKLNVGKNRILLKVRAENEKVLTYTFNIYRKDGHGELSEYNYLSEIIINGKSLKVNEDEYEYNITIPYSEDKVNIDVIPIDKTSTYTLIGNDILNVGYNIYIIKLESKNGNVKEYRVTIIMKDKDIKLSSNSKLKNIEINGYKIEFNKELYDYTLKIKNENKLNIIYSQEDIKSIVNISGNENLKNNSIIRITVKAEDNSYTEYRIKIEKSNTYYNLIFILLTILSLGIIIYLIYNYKKRLKN